MKVVIEISKRVYNDVVTNNGYSGRVLAEAIKNGTPLPKGHGRLIDADKLVQEYRTSNIVHHYGEQIVNKVNDAKTIIEAEMAESEDKE